MKRLFNHNVWITGASSGIGAAITKLFASERASIHAIYNSKADKEGLMNEVYKACPKHSIKGQIDCDLASAESIKSIQTLMTQIPVDVLINCAGICDFTNFENVTSESLARHMQVNYQAAFLLSQGACKSMRKYERDLNGLRGSIINISSISAVRGGIMQHHYCPTKAALHSLTVCLSESQGPHGIRVNTISPGTIITPINQDVLDNNLMATKRMAEAIPLKRLGHPDEIAQVALFLADGNTSSYVNGACIDVNGGWHNVLAGQTS